MAAVSQQASVQSIMLSDSEIGSASKAPKLISLNDHSSWKGRFQRFIEAIDTGMWIWVECEYKRPTQEG